MKRVIRLLRLVKPPLLALLLRLHLQRQRVEGMDLVLLQKQHLRLQRMGQSGKRTIKRELLEMQRNQKRSRNKEI
jgi:hypothetical protein